MKEFPVNQKAVYRDDFFKFVVDGDTLKKVYNDGREYVYATKDNPTDEMLYWNQAERQTIDYLKRNKVGTYKTRTEPNWDEDPSGRRVQFGTRTWYYFDFSNLFN